MKISLGEPLRFRVEASMRKDLKNYALDLAAVVGHPVSIGGAVRDLVARALATAPDPGYRSGFREGFVAGFADAKRRLAEARIAAAGDESGEDAGGPIGPQPSDDNDDYQGEGE